MADPDDVSSASGRAKRNTACTSCRDAKVRCNPSSDPDKPCQRCSKSGAQCVVDRTHKRMSRRNKLEELVQEIATIKQSVGQHPPASVSPGAGYQRQSLAAPPAENILPAIGLNSPASLPLPDSTRDVSVEKPSSSVNTVAPSPHSHTAAPNAAQDARAEPSLTRALASQPFSGADIDFYFEKYFEHYHPYMPIVRQRDPNQCYESGQLLFWVIIYIATRRYARNSTAMPFLMEALRKEIMGAVTDMPLKLPAANALVLVCTWMFPDIRFMSDPGSLYSAIALNAATNLGAHTGKGNHPEYSVGVFQNSFSNEEAAYTWAGINIVCQRVSSYMGFSPPGGLFNQSVQDVIDGRTEFHVPSSFRVLIECQKFCNHVSHTMKAALEENRGVSAHVVSRLETDWASVRGLICSDRSDALDRFNALLVQMEIQAYYMIPQPGYSPEAIKRDILRAYNTARAVIDDGLELDRKTNFMHHIPHFYFRSIITAACVVFKLIRSSYMDYVDRKEAEQCAANAITVCRRASILENDLPTRLENLLSSWFEMGQTARWQEEPISQFSCRLTASVTLDCLSRWKQDIMHSHNGLLAGVFRSINNGEEQSGGANPDLFQNMDWSFFDSFDWNFEQSGVPATG